MGIRGLRHAVQRHGVFSALSGDTVAIDGPALVHRISDACMRQRPYTSGFVCHPPYALLGRMVIGWLDELKNHNVKVRKIYFDGYLPPAKWEVRRERLLTQSKHMKALVSSQPFGSPKTPESAFSNLKSDTSLTRQTPRASSNTMPKPPFMVPAVLEALKASEEWGPLVLVVPGEADMFCAQDIRENGGTLLTSDSDLLIQDLGLQGYVSFFWDVLPADLTSKETDMVACRFSLHKVNDKLGLTNIGGLPRVVFEKQRGGMGFNEALQKARDSHEDTLNSLEFKSFMKKLELQEYIPSCHPVLAILSTLDPRISEVVIQTLLLEEESPLSALDPKTLRGPETLSIFLPIVVENRDKKSAWTSSTNIRQVAYSILGGLARRKPSTIIEYRTLDPSTALTGRQIEIPDIEESIDSCKQLVTLLGKLEESFAPSMRWLALGVYLDIEWTISEQRSPLSATLISRAANQSGAIEEYSWDLIHFTAQIHACLYSLRLVKQVLSVVLFLGQDLSAPAHKLHDSLAQLPLIAEWPTVEGMSDLLSEFGNAMGLLAITDMLGIPSIEVAPEPIGPRKRRKQDHEPVSRKGRQRDTNVSPSINPYAILSQASQD